jgi:hypothetical protein
MLQESRKFFLVEGVVREVQLKLSLFLKSLTVSLFMVLCALYIA